MAHDWESTPDPDAFDHRLLEAHAAAMAHTLLAPTTYISAASDATAISDDEANISDAPAMAPSNSDVATATFTAGAGAGPKSDSDSDAPPHPAAGGEWAWEAAAGPGPDDPFTEDWPTGSDGLGRRTWSAALRLLRRGVAGRAYGERSRRAGRARGGDRLPG